MARSTMRRATAVKSRLNDSVFDLLARVGIPPSCRTEPAATSGSAIFKLTHYPLLAGLQCGEFFWREINAPFDGQI